MVKRRPASEYTGRDAGRLRRTLSAAVIAWLSLLGAARADDLATMAILPGGRAGLLPRIELAADLPRAMVVGEIVRAVYAARDPHGRMVTALTSYLAAPPADGDELVPLPMSREFWERHVIGKAVPDRDLFRVLFSSRRTALICYALLGVDGETRAYIASQPSMIAGMDERDASAFASFAGVVRVQHGVLQLPGGNPAIWTELLGVDPKQPREAIHALLANDNGRLAAFTEALSELDATHRDLVMPPAANMAARIALVKAVYRTFVLVDQGRNLSDLTFQRVPYGPAELLATLSPHFIGTVGAPEAYWRLLLETDDVPEDGSDEDWDGLDASASSMAASILERFVREPLPGRHELLNVVSFVERLARRFPAATLADRVLLGHAFRRYPALLLTLERIGVDDLDVWRTLVMRARWLEAHSGGADADARCALVQAPIALIDRAVQVGALDAPRATALLKTLSATDPTARSFGRQVGRWMIEALLPAVGAAAAPSTTADEATLLDALAGLGSPVATRLATGPAVHWEDSTYRVDPAASEMVRLREVRARQGGNSLDTALTLIRAGMALSAGGSGEARRTAAAALKQVQEALAPLDDDDAPPAQTADARKIIDQAVSDTAHTMSASRAGAIAEHLEEAETSVLAETLTSIVYALWIGDPDGQAFLGGNVARRHEFGRRAAPPAEREHTRWMIPEETSAVGEPWHVRGSLLALDVGLGRLALRRTTGDLPARQPRLNESDRRAFVTSFVLMPSIGADQAAADRLVSWLENGARRVSTASPPELEAIILRLELDERRAAAVRWTAANDRDDVTRLFLLTELTMAGRPADQPLPDGWGPASTARSGCLCRVFVDPPAPHRPSRLARAATVASVIDDLELQILAEMHRLTLPVPLGRGVLSAALQEYLDNARPAYLGDWWTFGELARTLSRDQVADDVSALTAGGMLVPASEPRSSDSHP